MRLFFGYHQPSSLLQDPLYRRQQEKRGNYLVEESSFTTAIEPR
jgi:hypothetical protein